MKQSCVYILANRRHGTLYVGGTSDVMRRVWQHRSGEMDGFIDLSACVGWCMRRPMNLDAIQQENNFESLAKGAETEADRTGQSAVAGFVRRLRAWGPWTLAFARVTLWGDGDVLVARVPFLGRR